MPEELQPDDPKFNEPLPARKLLGWLYIIPLTQGCVALVDREDYEQLRHHKWQVMKQRNRSDSTLRLYARRTEKRKNVWMHTEILPAPPGMFVDHFLRYDEEGIVDNRRRNLRLATRTQNGANARKRKGVSAFKGVMWAGWARRWRAQIRPERKQINLGYFKHEVNAAYAHDLAAVEHFGEFALTNFPVPGSKQCLFPPS